VNDQTPTDALEHFLPSLAGYTKAEKQQED
jgi:hypothetical protein